MATHRSEWLLSTINAVRDVVTERLRRHSLDPDAERDMQLALDAIEVMWEELAGQSDLLTIEHRRYEEFFEFAPDAYAITDAVCGVREANRALAELLQCPRADLLGKPLDRHVCEPERAAFRLNYLAAAAIREPRPHSWRTRLQRARAPAVEALVSVRPIPLRRSGVAGLCWLIRPA